MSSDGPFETPANDTTTAPRSAREAVDRIDLPKPAEQPDHILQFFNFAHLSEHLQEISRPFRQLAHDISNTVPRNPERTVALRKLLEAKDAAVRALVAK